MPSAAIVRRSSAGLPIVRCPSAGLPIVRRSSAGLPIVRRPPADSVSLSHRRRRCGAGFDRGVRRRAVRLSSAPRGVGVRPGVWRAVRESPHPWGSRIGDVTSDRIVRGGLARIERRRIMSRWARTARGEVDCVALISHCASRARVLPGWSAPPRARRRPARASARGRREPGPGPCPIPSCLRPGPQDHRPSPRDRHLTREIVG